MPAGGYRQGAGRKTKPEEERAKKACTDAIIKKYGSLEAGIIALLDSNEPMLRRFVFEHAIGKPREKVDLQGDLTTSTVYRYELPKNGRELAEEAIEHTNGNGNGSHN